MLYSKVAMVSLDAIIQTSYNKSAAADDILQGELVGKSLGNVPDNDLIENYDELSANEQELENMERADELFNHISNMRTQDKEILQLYYVDGKKYKEIAQILGITMSSVKVRILRAKESLRKIQAMVGNQPINLI